MSICLTVRSITTDNVITNAEKMTIAWSVNFLAALKVVLEYVYESQQ